MPKFFEYRKKPDPKKNFFQNYSDHLDYLWDKTIDVAKNISEVPTLDGKFDIIGKEALARLNVFEPLRDGHDYMDEVVGATAIPLAGALLSLGAFCYAIKEGIHALGIKAHVFQQDYENHSQHAVNSLLVSAAALAFAVASLVKSFISLFTRPIATLVNGGLAKQDEDRFKNEESVVGAFKGF